MVGAEASEVVTAAAAEEEEVLTTVARVVGTLV